jgi:four helix bundle protein
MAGILRFEEIKAWQTARELTRFVYTLSGDDVFAKDFGLKDQIQRAAVSVMSNIAEVFESRTDAQFITYLGHAKASCGEVRSQLYVALDQAYITQAHFDEAFELADKTSRQVARLIEYLAANPRSKRVREESESYNV